MRTGKSNIAGGHGGREGGPRLGQRTVTTTRQYLGRYYGMGDAFGNSGTAAAGPKGVGMGGAKNQWGGIDLPTRIPRA